MEHLQQHQHSLTHTRYIAIATTHPLKFKIKKIIKSQECKKHHHHHHHHHHRARKSRHGCKREHSPRETLDLILRLGLPERKDDPIETEYKIEDKVEGSSVCTEWEEEDDDNEGKFKVSEIREEEKGKFGVLTQLNSDCLDYRTLLLFT